MQHQEEQTGRVLEAIERLRSDLDHDARERVTVLLSTLSDKARG